MRTRADRRRSALGTLRLSALLWVLMLETLIGLLLVGGESEGALANEGFTAERAQAWLFKCTTTGTVEAIKFHTAEGTASTCTSAKFGIWTDKVSGEASLHSPNTFLSGSEGTFAGTPAKGSTNEVTGLSVSVTSGSYYWLVFIPIGGTLRFKPETPSEANTGAHPRSQRSAGTTKYKAVSEAITWIETAEGNGTPIWLAAIGKAAASSTSRSAEDTLVLSDSAERTSLASRAGADSLSLSDSPARTSAQPRSAADALSLSDEASRVASTSRFTADTLMLSDEVSRTVTRTRSAADSLALSEAAQRTTNAPRVASDELLLSDDAARSLTRVRTAADTLSLSDSAHVLHATFVTASDTLTLSDAASRSATSTRAAEDVLELSESATSEFAHPPLGSAKITISHRPLATTKLTNRALADTRITRGTP